MQKIGKSLKISLATILFLQLFIQFPFLSSSRLIQDNNSLKVHAEDDWDDEDWDDEDWDDDWADWDDEDWEENWDDEDSSSDNTASLKQINSNIQARAQKLNKQSRSGAKKEVRREYIEDLEEFDFLKEFKKDEGKILVSRDETLNALFNVYGEELRGLNPEDPKDRKEINKLLEIIGTPTKTPKTKRQREIVYDDDVKINFSARNISIRDAFATLARISGKSITVSGSIQERDVISVIEINDEPFTKAFFSMVQAAGVDFTVTGDTYTILRRTGNSQTKIFAMNPTEVDINLPILERVTDLSYDNEDLNSIIKDLTNRYGIDIVMTATPTERITTRVRDVNVEEALTLLLSGSPFEFTRTGDTFVIYNKVNMNFSLDKKMVLFPIKYLEAKSVSSLLPEQLKSLVKVSEEQNSLIAEGSKEELLQLFKYLRIVDAPIHQVELDVHIVEILKSLDNSRSLINDTLRVFTVGQFGSIAQGSGNAIEANFGVDNWDFGQDTLSVFQNSPTFSRKRNYAQVKVSQKLMVASGKSAKLSFDENRNVVLGQGAAAGTTGVVQNQQIQRIQAGTSMDITPIVGDNGVITLKVDVEVSENSGDTSSQNVPAVTTSRSLSSEVQVLDHETIAIGGLFQDNNSVGGAEIPILGNIPILGSLFGNRTKSKTARELIVLITPHQRTQKRIDNEDEEVYVQAEAN